MDPVSFNRISKALADPRRFAILERIAASSETACQTLCGEFPVSKATLSHHLQELETAGLVAMRKQGKFAYLTLQKKVWREYHQELKKRLG
jgi:ArsR family transcriptional regulator, arsenate/arsenite/antimonite-responsive transcriptional repressor